MTTARARSRRSSLAILASACAHLALFVLLARVAPALLPPSPSEAPVFRVALEPSAAGGGATAARASVRPERAVQSAPVLPAQALSAPSRSPATPRPVASAAVPAPATAAPARAAAPAQASARPAAGTQDDGRWRLSGAGAGDADGAARALARTTVGCDHQAWLHLTAAEHDRCGKPFLEGMRSTMKIDAIPAGKRAYYDQVQAAYAKMHEGAPVPVQPPIDGRYANLGVEERWAGPPGAHMPGFGCSPFLLAKGAAKRLPPHALKLGPCAVSPPSGLFTEEADVRPPPTLREQQADAAHAAQFAPPPRAKDATPKPRMPTSASPGPPPSS